MQRSVGQCVGSKSGVASFTEEVLDELARHSGFVKRRSNKLTPMALVSCLLHFIAQPKISFRMWASWITMNFARVSKQALWKRIDANAVEFLKTLMCRQLKETTGGSMLRGRGVFSTFSKVLVQDSTTIHLPDKFQDVFPGSANRHAAYATMKIQLIYDLLADVPFSFSISSFRRNDQAASPDILGLIKEKDLVLRDLGYFVLDTFNAIQERGAYFLSRYRFGTNLYVNPDDEAPFDFAKYLRKMKKNGIGSVDMNLHIGAKNRLKLRVVAVRVPDKIAAERKRRAKSNRDSSLNPGKDRLSMLNWEVFVTNVGDSTWSTETVAEVYGFRWKVESIFKVWKSYFKLPDVPDSCSQNQLECMIYARLIFTILYHAAIWVPCKRALDNPERRQWVSPFKLASLVPLYINDFILLVATGKLNQKLIQLIKDFALYDKRRRLSFEEILSYYCNRQEDMQSIMKTTNYALG